jgi:DNA replication protein DnaC
VAWGDDGGRRGAQRTNIIFAGPTGIGKSHLAVALGYAACLRGHSVLLPPPLTWSIA